MIIQAVELLLGFSILAAIIIIIIGIAVWTIAAIRREMK